MRDASSSIRKNRTTIGPLRPLHCLPMSTMTTKIGRGSPGYLRSWASSCFLLLSSIRNSAVVSRILSPSWEPLSQASRASPRRNLSPRHQNRKGRRQAPRRRALPVARPAPRRNRPPLLRRSHQVRPLRPPRPRRTPRPPRRAKPDPPASHHRPLHRVGVARPRLKFRPWYPSHPRPRRLPPCPGTAKVRCSTK